MKKLMTTIAAATAAFGLFAAEGLTLPHGASMDSEEGYTVDTGIMAAGVDSNWVTDAESDESLIKAYEESEALPHPSDIFWTTQDQYLHVEAEQPLYRAIATPTGTKTANLVPVDIAVDGERDGIIIDQLVKFSAFDAETEKIDVEAGAKIAVWVKAGEEDDGTGTLQITTAKLDENEFLPTETTINTEIPVTVADWHQLKITTIKAAVIDGEKVVPGFIIELNGEVIAKDAELWPEGWEDCLTDAAKELIAQNKLFPSMVKYTLDNAGTLFGVAYKGTGAIDDVAVAEAPYVPPAPTTYTLAVTEPKEEEGTLTTDPEAGQIAAGTEVTVTATPVEGYELESITTNGQVLAGITFEMPAENVTVAATFKASEPDPTVIDPDDPSLDGKTAGDVFKKIPDALKPVNASKFAAWCQKDGNKELVGEGGADAMLDAFLLDCLNDTDVIEEAKKAFVIESIEFVDGEWVVKVAGEKGQNDEYGNGFVNIVPAEELKDVAEVGVAEFFKAQLTITPTVK